jgi:serine/threonine protein kinase
LNNIVSETEDSNKPVISKRVIVLLSIIIVVVLVIHSINPDYLPFFTIDIISIYLIGLLIIVLFLPLITHIKIGEIEISLKEQVDNLLNKPEHGFEEEEAGKLIDYKDKSISEQLVELHKSDPIIALAKLRIELEGSIKHLFNKTSHNKPENERINSIIQILKNLASNNIISHSSYSSLREIFQICNRAIHGEKIEKDEASDIINLGIEALSYLNSKIIQHSDLSLVIYNLLNA